MTSGRPPRGRAAHLYALLGAALAALALPALARAEEFRRDQTPLSPAVTGADAGTPAPDTAAAAGGVASGGGIARMVVGLAIVIAVIYGLYWMLRTLARSRGLRPDGGGIGVVATQALAQNRSVHLLRVGDELVLVGSAETGVTPLRVYGPDEARRLGLAFDPLDELAFAGAPSAASQASGRGFGAFVEELRKRTAR